MGPEIGPYHVAQAIDGDQREEVDYEEIDEESESGNEDSDFEEEDVPNYGDIGDAGSHPSEVLKKLIFIYRFGVGPYLKSINLLVLILYMNC